MMQLWSKALLLQSKTKEPLFYCWRNSSDVGYTNSLNLKYKDDIYAKIDENYGFPHTGAGLAQNSSKIAVMLKEGWVSCYVHSKIDENTLKICSYNTGAEQNYRSLTRYPEGDLYE